MSCLRTTREDAYFEVAAEKERPVEGLHRDRGLVDAHRVHEAKDE